MAMFVKRFGQGERVFVGLHGWSGDHTTFAPVARYLPLDATLYSVDLPGCGQSPPPRELTLAGLADEIAAGIATLGSQSITVVGNCSGAILALAALPRIAERVNRLVLIDPFAFAPWYFKLFVTTPVGKYAYYSTFANPLGRWITNLSLKRHRTEESDLTGSFRAIDHAVAHRYLQLLTSMDGIADFAWIRHPVDIVYGERTFGAIRRSVEMWRSVWPQARAFELTGAGHLPIEEAPESLSRVIFDYV